MYKITLTRQAAKAFEALMRAQPSMGRRVANVFEELAKDPSIGIPLRGELRGLLKYRVGPYRIIYQVLHAKLLITIIDVGHRKEVYR